MCWVHWKDVVVMCHTELSRNGYYHTMADRESVHGTLDGGLVLMGVKTVNNGRLFEQIVCDRLVIWG